MKWTKFSDGEFPYVGMRATIFVTDWNRVWIDNMNREGWKCFVEKFPECAWADIQYPEVPKKELHKCEKGSLRLLFNVVCEEINDRLLLSFENIDIKEKVTMTVSVCPFCGYSIKEKE